MGWVVETLRKSGGCGGSRPETHANKQLEVQGSRREGNERDVWGW